MDTLDQLCACERLGIDDWLILRVQLVAVQTASDERPPRSRLSHVEWANLLFMLTLADSLARASGSPMPGGEARSEDEALLASFEAAVMALHDRDLATFPTTDPGSGDDAQLGK
jgi:hypothetical protein